MTKDERTFDNALRISGYNRKARKHIKICRRHNKPHLMPTLLIMDWVFMPITHLLPWRK